MLDMIREVDIIVPTPPLPAIPVIYEGKKSPSELGQGLGTIVAYAIFSFCILNEPR